MPKTKETSNHPCHFLSLPSAKRFWCRHCMSVFEDAITRWRHSRTCRYGVVNNFMRRRQLEAKALQNTTKPNPIEARLEKSVSPSEEPIVEIPGPSSTSPSSTPSGSTVKTNQGTSNDLFRCFICHNKFSTLEEMRHHVKYPCNNKKIVTDVPNPAVTVYIDEFTDRSRQWEPQPQTEEVMTSEYVPTMVSHETVQTNMDHKTKTEDSRVNTVAASPNKEGGRNITPTNIYVNEQGETVIEVENLDLNSEGGELSLAHLLAQLSQQGIVFDKTKASQMQAQHEVATVSDPESGEVYATSTTYDPSVRTPLVMKEEEEESQSTAEDAANTLAQLAVFRGGYNRFNQEVVAEMPQASVSSDLQRQYMVETVTTEGYHYTEAYTMPHITNATNDQQISISGDALENNIKVEYQYDYLPTGQTVPANMQSASQISIHPGSILHHPSVTAHQLEGIEIVRDEIENSVRVDSQTVQIQQDEIQPQIVTYITPSSSSSSSSTIQHIQSSRGEAMMIEDFVVEHPGTTQHHYQTDHHIQHPNNISVSVSADGIVQSAESFHRAQQQAHDQTNIPTALLHAGQNSYIVINSEDNSTEIICDSTGQEVENEICENVHPGTVSESSILHKEIIENHIREQERLQHLHQEHIVVQEEPTEEEQIANIQPEPAQEEQMDSEPIQDEQMVPNSTQAEQIQTQGELIQQEQIQHVLQEETQREQMQQNEQFPHESQFPSIPDPGNSNNLEEFEVQTVTLQEIAATETTECAQYVDPNHTQPSNATVSTTPVDNTTHILTTTSSSSDNNTTTDSYNTNGSFHVKGTINESYTDNNIRVNCNINQQPSIQEGTSITVVEEPQSPLCQEVSAISSESPETSSTMPIYVVSSQGGLQLLTSAGNLINQDQPEQTSQ